MLGNGREIIEMFSYSQAEAALARMYETPSDPSQRGAFRARIRNFQKLGIPFGVNPGRGSRIEYGLPEIYQWMLCLELAEFGMPPSTIAAILKKRWKPTIRSEKSDGILFNLTRAAAEDCSKNVDAQDVYLCVSPAAMSQAWSKSNRPDLHFRWFNQDQSDLFLRNVTGAQRRACVINVTYLLRSLQEAICAVANEEAV
jgi:hypothetical protein